MQSKAEKAGKPILLVTNSTVPMADTSPLGQIQEALNKGVLKDFQDTFVFAQVEAFSQAHAEQNFVDPKVAAEFGYPCTVSVWLGGASKALWSQQLIYQTFDNRNTKLTDSALEDAFKTAKSQVDTWNEELNKIVTDAGAKKISDKELATVELQTQIARQYAKGFMANEAVKALETAQKLAKKADKDSAAIADMAYEAAGVLKTCGEWEKAQTAFLAFQKKFKDHAKNGEAGLMEAQCAVSNDDVKGALAILDRLLKDKSQATIHETVKTLRAELVEATKKN